MRKLSLFTLYLDQELNFEELIENFSVLDDVILVGFDFPETLMSRNQKDNIRFLDLSIFKRPILDFAKNDSIFLIDIDENIDEKLKDEIIKILGSDFEYSAYSIRREFYFITKKIKYGTVENNTEIRLFDRNFCEFKNNLPLLGNVIFKGKTGELTNQIQNLSYKDFDTYNRKQTVYNSKIAKMLFNNGTKINIIKYFSDPFLFFIHQYFYKLGFLDGKEGYILAYIHSFGKLKKNILLWLLKNKMK